MTESNELMSVLSIILCFFLSIVILTNSAELYAPGSPLCEEYATVGVLEPDPNFDHSHYRCPKTFQTVVEDRGAHFLQHYMCNRTSRFHYKLLSMKHFLYYMVHTNISILYVGDSVTEQMYFSFLCGVETEESSLFSLAKKRTAFSFSSFLTSSLPTGCTMNSVVLKNHPYVMSEDWYTMASSKRFSHVVINTGHWWSRNHIGDNHTTCFEQQFSKGSKLYNMLTKLVNYPDLTLIWRDITPGGICGKENQLSYSFCHYQTYNLIATRFLRGLAISIPSIWNDTKYFWFEHVSSNDPLHWCLFLKYNVPNIWNTLLFKLLRQDS